MGAQEEGASGGAWDGAAAASTIGKLLQKPGHVGPAALSCRSDRASSRRAGGGSLAASWLRDDGRKEGQAPRDHAANASPKGLLRTFRWGPLYFAPKARLLT